MEEILVVDDSKVQLLSVSILLRKEGYIVEDFSEARAAKEALEKKRFDLVLCDLQMPEVNGIAMLRLSKTLYPLVPVIIMTAYGDRESAIEALSIGAEDYIFKASGKREEEEFLIRIRRAIEKSKLQKSLINYQEHLELMVQARTRELQEAQEQLIQSEKLRSLGIMTNGIAHDFNNILGVILGRTQLLMRKTHDGDVLNDLRTIEMASLKGSSTIRRMQDYTRIRKDETFTSLQLNEIANEVIEITKTRWKDEAHEKGVTIHVHTEFADIPYINGNESELKDVLINVIFNAIDAMPGGGTITVRTRSETVDGDRWVLLEIADTGSGIAEELQSKVFEPFFTTKDSGGWGLGMSVAYGIIQRHKGHIGFTSSPNKGTTFFLRFPGALFLQQMPQPNLEKATSTDRNHKKILVIDDDDSMRVMLSEILEIDRHEVVAASSGIEALRLFKDRRFDVVLTDLGMPEMSGWDLAHEIKKVAPATRIIMITGWGTQLDKQKAIDSGVEKILPKPVSCEEILKSVAG